MRQDIVSSSLQDMHSAPTRLHIHQMYMYIIVNLALCQMQKNQDTPKENSEWINQEI